MGLLKGIEIRLLSSVKGGMVEFYASQSSNETVLVQIPPQTIDDLFVHRFQTDQLLVVRGSFVLVVLHNRRYQYITLSDRQPMVVTIPPFVPHAAINLNSEPCLLVNAVLRHAPADVRDYLPVKRPFPYDMAAAQALMNEVDYPLSA